MRFFQPELEKVGYAGVFALKSRARTMSSDEQLDVDGCAIFYRKNKYVYDADKLCSCFFFQICNEDSRDKMKNLI